MLNIGVVGCGNWSLTILKEIENNKNFNLTSIACRNYNSKKICSVVLVTSDKSYKNLELDRGYRETDILGGYDPYSASKACAELIIQCYLFLFFFL